MLFVISVINSSANGNNNIKEKKRCSSDNDVHCIMQLLYFTNQIAHARVRVIIIFTGFRFYLVKYLLLFIVFFFHNVCILNSTLLDTPNINDNIIIIILEINNINYDKNTGLYNIFKHCVVIIYYDSRIFKYF